ncbi:MAG: hypothetical protein ABFC57_04975 [Veillonellales bacterium]
MHKSTIFFSGLFSSYDLIEYAKEHPDKVKFGHAGIGPNRGGAIPNIE